MEVQGEIMETEKEGVKVYKLQTHQERPNLTVKNHCSHKLSFSITIFDYGHLC